METPQYYKEQFLEWCNGRYNLNDPQTIQDKIQWLKLNDSTPLKTRCADKILVHDYCKEKLGKDICIPILKIYDTPTVNISNLPDQFVLKCNHGSGMNIIIPNKNEMDFNIVCEKLTKWMATDFAFQNHYEYHYHDIQRKIFAEKYMNDGHSDLIDYKFICFNGKPTFCQVIDDRNGKNRHLNYYDMDWVPQEGLERLDFPANYDIKHTKPVNFEKMVEYAKILSKDFNLVRVDFYEIDGVVYLGELTFTPGSGTFHYKNPNDNLRIGNMLKLK